MTIKISNEYGYIKDLDCAVYIDKYDGSFCYQDVCGYKSYKTIAGLNRHLAGICKAANKETVEVVL